MENTKRRRRRTRKTRSFSLKRLPALLLLPLLAIMIGTSFQQMKASVINGQTDSYLAFWHEELKQDGEGFAVSDKSVATVREGAERALALAPGAPEYLSAKAKIEDWVVTDAQRQGFVPDKEYQQQGLQAYRDAIVQRPAWPYTWAELAMAKARASEVDQEFFNALERATSLGPWERQVMDTVTQLGLWYGDWLPDEVKVAVDENLVRYADVYPAQAMAIARNQDKTEVVCPLVSRPEWFRRDCE